MSQSQRILLLILISLSLIVLLTGCSDDEIYFNLSGYWEGENTNSATSQDWPFTVYIEHRGTDISGVYTDYRGSLSLRNITYSGEDIGFVIDLWPEIVTFFGVVQSDSSMNGTWSYTADSNIGVWYLLKDRDPEEEEEEEEEEENTSSDDPFTS
ncbi:hypothetical protein K8T06_03355 [bacterium]|nr:hypothetical protein [bacterium]